MEKLSFSELKTGPGLFAGKYGKKFTTLFGAVCRTDGQMTCILHVHWKPK